MSDIKEVIGADGEAVPAVSELRLQPRVAVLKMNEGPDICILETGLIGLGWLVDWLIGWLVDWWIDWLVDWLMIDDADDADDDDGGDDGDDGDDGDGGGDDDEAAMCWGWPWKVLMMVMQDILISYKC